MLGLDFGTTNSAVGAVDGSGASRLASFRLDGRPTTTFRSVLYFSPDDASIVRGPIPYSGPAAIEAYRAAGSGAGGRFMQSLKSFLASRLFKETYVFGWRFTLEDLIALILRDLRAAAIEQLGDPGDAVLIGRPVHYVVEAGSEPDAERDRHAVERLTAAAQRAGFSSIQFAFEPVAAAYEYERGLDHDELVLIGDFGGGTSDFCLIRLGPGARAASDRAATILGVDGVPLAGNSFDARLVRRVVAPALGLGSSRRSEGGQRLPIPSWIYTRLERWEDMALLAAPDTLETLRRLHAQALEPEKIEGLIQLIRGDLGYLLYQQVEGAKLALSEHQQVRFGFDELSAPIDAAITRHEFEQWIAPELDRIAACIDGLLARCNLPASAVDRVFLTGGSSLVPSVRALFEGRFGAARLRGGNELTTVAHGLALMTKESESARN